MKKNIIGRCSAFILAMMLAFTSMPLTAYAEDGQEISVENQDEQGIVSDNKVEDIETITVSENTISENTISENTIYDDSISSLDDASISDNDIVVEQLEEYSFGDFEEYTVVYEYEGANSIESNFIVPYVATYYFNPKPSVNDNIQIPLYLTDAEQSEYLKKDNSKKLDLIYEVDGVSKTIQNIPIGDYTLTLGKLSEGNHVFSVQVYDKSTGLKSHKLYNDLWVINPSTYNISAAQTYTMTTADLSKYGINNKDSKNAQDMVNTRNGLNKLFAEKQAAGYRKIVLLSGTYRINGEDSTGGRSNSIVIPTNFTVDMNGSTFKLNTITTDSSYLTTKNFYATPSASGCIVVMEDTIDSHLINGTLEGDRFERKEMGLEESYLGEGINTILMRGGKYCTLENLTVKDTTGHSVVKFYRWGKEIYLKGYTRTAIFDGKEITASNCSTSSYTDLTPILEQNALESEQYMGENYMYVGHPQGYRGIYGDSAIVYVSFYDSSKKYMETVTGYQYRKMLIPDGAKYARVTLLGTGFMEADYSNPDSLSQTVSIYGKHFGDYCEFADIDFVDTRTCALAPATCNNLLIEGCTYTRSGNSITPAAVDFEDGAQECQDVYYQNNKVIEASGTMTVIDNYGYNHLFIDNEKHSYEIRRRVVGGLITGIDDGTSIIKWGLGDYTHAAFGRVMNNKCGMINFSDIINYSNGQPVREPDPVDFIVRNCDITGGYMDALPKHVTFEDCTFYKVNASNARLVNCTIQLNDGVGAMIGTELYCYNCTFKTMDGTKTHTLPFNQARNAVRVFENCKFLGRTETNNFLASGIFKGCEFEDFSVTGWVREGDDSLTEAVLFEDCTINSTGGFLFNVGPYTYNSGYINYTFKNCNITHTGKNLVQITATPTAGSQIVFDGCAINKKVDTSINPSVIKVTNEVKLLDTSIKGYSVSLNGEIALNYYIQIPDDIHNNSSAIVHFALPNGTTSDVKVSAGKVDNDNSKTYIYTCNVPAAYMTGNVSAQVQILSNGKPAQLSETYTCSVKSYADAVISNSTKYGADNVAMVKAMLNYGAYAQQYFGVNTGNMANSNMYTSATDPVLNFSQNLSSQQISGISTKGDLEFYGASLVCKGETSLKLYFGSKSGAALSSGRFTVKAVSGGKTRNCSATITNNMYVVTLTGIAAAELDDTYQFTITDTKNSANTFTFGYSPMNYIANAQKSSDKSLVYLTRAIYYYNQAANKVF